MRWCLSKRRFAAAAALRVDGIEEFHGYELAKQLADDADRKLLTAYGTLYRALGRLEAWGCCRAAGRTPRLRRANRPGRRLYTLTALGEAAATAADARCGDACAEDAAAGGAGMSDRRCVARRGRARVDELYTWGCRRPARRAPRGDRIRSLGERPRSRLPIAAPRAAHLGAAARRHPRRSRLAQRACRRRRRVAMAVALTVAAVASSACGWCAADDAGAVAGSTGALRCRRVAAADRPPPPPPPPPPPCAAARVPAAPGEVHQVAGVRTRGQTPPVSDRGRSRVRAIV